jgi:hypothetical protein
MDRVVKRSNRTLGIGGRGHPDHNCYTQQRAELISCAVAELPVLGVCTGIVGSDHGYGDLSPLPGRDRRIGDPHRIAGHRRSADRHQPIAAQPIAGASIGHLPALGKALIGRHLGVGQDRDIPDQGQIIAPICQGGRIGGRCIDRAGDRGHDDRRREESLGGGWQGGRQREGGIRRKRRDRRQRRVGGRRHNGGLGLEEGSGQCPDAFGQDGVHIRCGGFRRLLSGAGGQEDCGKQHQKYGFAYVAHFHLNGIGTGLSPGYW